MVFVAMMLFGLWLCCWLDRKVGVAKQRAEFVETHRDEHLAVVFAVNNGG
jgi:hypothetical protein